MVMESHPDEDFTLQYTVRGNPSRAKLEAHLQSVRDACSLICSLGGHAKPVGQQPEAASGAPARKSYEFYKGPKGKTFIKLPDGELPKTVKCDIHPGKTMKL